jgi:hypothetical protein
VASPDERLRRLERELWWWKRALAGLGIIVAALAGMLIVAVRSGVPTIANLNSIPIQTSIPTQIAARKFVLIAPDGKELAILQPIEGGASLTLSSPQGRQASLRVNDPHNPGPGQISIVNSKGQKMEWPGAASLELSYGPSSAESAEAYLTVDASLMPASLKLSSPKGGDASLGVTDPHELMNGKGRKIRRPGGASLDLSAGRPLDLELPQASLAVSSDKTFRFSLDRKMLNSAISFAGAPDGSVSMGLSGNEKGLQQVSSLVDISVDAAGNPAISLNDPADPLRTRAVLGSVDLKNKRTGSTEKTAPSAVTLFDKKGNVIWRAPGM